MVDFKEIEKIDLYQDLRSYRGIDYKLFFFSRTLEATKLEDVINIKHPVQFKFLHSANRDIILK